MHPFICFMLVVMATHFSGIESFNLGRNVSILVSRDDSRESSITSNDGTLKKGDVILQVEGRHLVNQEAHKIFDGPMFRQVVEQNGFSNEILGSQIANFLATTQKPPTQLTQKLHPTPTENDNRKSTADAGPFAGNLDDISFEVRDISVPVNPVMLAGGQQVSTNNVHHFKQSDEREDDDDNSNEVRSSISASSNRDGIHLDATDFHKRPQGGMLIQPESEDWFLVRQYMHDEQFRGAGKELAKEYFWQPVKGPKGLDSESEEDDSNESS
ncbi:uncharacterized protein LOC124313289 [Daphnia pulicaria]|uniref:uncharacterized protein LOC124313289 n=1 Tax=Daphnia pulicaria TaxID=35523 RepID=UPI001EEB27F4|nr:uncharacterized protein LOC124313289 [Daphnia pulicaria]